MSSEGSGIGGGQLATRTRGQPLRRRRLGLPLLGILYLLGPTGCDDGAAPIDAACPELGDRDADDVCDDTDNCPAAPNPRQEDGDGDGVGNACDPSNDDPCAGLGGDADGDAVCQAIDNCATVANADQADADGDRLGDACDDEDTPCVAYGGDLDGDLICNAFDNCVAVANSDQANGDGDDLGDACDPVDGSDVCAGRGGDADDDQICGIYDNCPTEPNLDQRDQDGDGAGDPCDPTPGPCDDLGGDSDGDTICDNVDNCPNHSNITQIDRDADGVGDVCDPMVPADPSDSPCSGLGGDPDNDDWCSLYDNCPLTSNPTQADIDGNGLGDACQEEACNGVDDNGDGQVDEGFQDTDGDGIADCVDLCDEVGYADVDGDGLDDCVDPCPNDPLNDSDGDGLCALGDNCPETTNASQADSDGDGIGNACDQEQCDGLDNDGDAGIDEWLSDADGDGTCDAIDVCPGDAQNDGDGDGLCGNDDNCPVVANPTQADADDDGWGDACDVDSVAGCAAAAGYATPGAVPLPSGLTVRGIVADDLRGLIYASVGSSDPTYGNSIIAIHADNPSIAWATFVGSEPGTLAIAADGSVLYVGLSGAAAVRRVNLAERRACLFFYLGTGYWGDLLGPGDMGVLPSHPESVVVSTRGSYHNFGGVFVYDNGVRRAIGTTAYSGPRELVVASDTVAYGYNNSSSEFGFRKLSISPSGITQEWVQKDLISGYSTDIVYADGAIYATSGAIVDPQVPGLLGTTAGSGPVAVDPALQEVYYGTSATSIAVYDTTTFLWKRDLSLPGSGTPQQLIRWGASGLAMRTSTGLQVVPDLDP